jgi:transposase
MPEEKLIYVDEAGFDSYIYREYGRAPRGVKVPGVIPGKKFKRTNIVAGQCQGKIIAPFQYSGSTDSQLFEFWFKNILLTAITVGSVIIMDNASFHRKAVLRQMALSAGCSIIFLPPYSPDLNLIENYWAWLKQKLKKILPVFSDFDHALSACF